MYDIRGVVPGSVVSFVDRDKKQKEGLVLLIRSQDTAVIKSEDGTRSIKKKFCTLVNPTISGHKYDLHGEPIQ